MGGREGDPVLEIRRSSGKELNPRFIPCFQDRIAASSLDPRRDERGKEGLEEDAGDGLEGYVGEEGMTGYSRREVTVIDTSREVWKFGKVVFRRKDVWEVRDRKGKGQMRKKKKRKLGEKRNSIELAGAR